MVFGAGVRTITVQGEPLTVKGQLIQWVHGRDTLPWGTSPRELNPQAVRTTLKWVERLFGPKRYFHLDVEGWETLPPSPALFVSNHSGGTTIPDAWGFLAAWYQHFDVAHRPMFTLAHEMILATRTTGEYFGQRGILQANRKIALETLTNHQRDLLVMPGGDQDTWRPYRDRFRVQFAGRTGYAKLALQAGVPIVPVANAGAHETLIVLRRGRRIARALGLSRLTRSEVFPVHLSLPWGLAVGPLPHFPPPTTLRYRFGAPIIPDASENLPEADAVEALDRRVQAAVQGLLDKLAKT